MTGCLELSNIIVGVNRQRLSRMENCHPAFFMLSSGRGSEKICLLQKNSFIMELIECAYKPGGAYGLH